MAKKKTPTKKKATKKVPSGVAAKKRPRAWTLVTFADLEVWREASGLPKKRAAEHLGVTNSTYHNWARGIAIPNTNTQKKVRETIDKGDPAKVNHNGNGHASNEAGVRATAEIVTAYLGVNGKTVNCEELPRLVRAVRQATGG